MSVSRRDFLKTSGVLIVSFSTASLAEPLAFVQGPFDTHSSHVDPKKLDSWIAVSSDGTITAYTGKCDFGQGMFTVQTQLVAEELCVSLDRIKLIQCDTSMAPDQGTTSGSQSTPTNFNSDNLAQAAATAREALINMAADQLGEPAGQLTAADGVITGKSGRRVAYAELIGSKRFNLPLSKTAARRSPSQWTLLGKPVRALEAVALMTGQFEFIHNVRVPGMLHGRVVRPPEVGATIASVDQSSVKGIAGFVKVVVRNNFVGVIAEKQWQAFQAARQLKVEWNSGPRLPEQKTFFDSLRKRPSQDALLVDSKDVAQRLADARIAVHATYVCPYQMHGRTDGYLSQNSAGSPWDASNILVRKGNRLLDDLEIPKIDPKLLAKIIGKDRTIKQATRSEKRAASLGQHSFRHTNATAMDSLGIPQSIRKAAPWPQWQHCYRELHAHIHAG